MPPNVWSAAGWMCLLFLGSCDYVRAAVPMDLSNFQNEYVCDLETLIVRPGTVADVQQAVARYSDVRSNGRGHSWNRPFFCANISNPSATRGPAVNIQLTTIRPLRIKVLEDEMAVWVDAGVTTVNLIEYLADYVTAKAPTGYTLGAFPWYVYQSIGGAVATGTHGSSLTYNSLSHQILEMEMVLANGTLMHLSPETTPFLMRAARVSVGRLGVITRLKMRIVREHVVKRELRVMPVTQFLSILQAAQQRYLATGAMPPELNETEWFWQTQRSQILMVSFTRGDTMDGNATAPASVLSSWTPDSTTIYNSSLSLLQTASRLEDLPLLASVTYNPEGLSQAAAQTTSALLQNTINAPLPTFPRPASVKSFVKRMNNIVEAFEDATLGARPGSSMGVSWPLPTPKPINIMYGQVSSANPLMDANRAGLGVIAKNATLEAHKSYLYQPQALETQIKNTLYDQYEVSVPVSSMHECVAGMMAVMYGDDIDSLLDTTRNVDKGFRSAPLMRLVGKEDGLLSQTGDEPRLFFNIEDYLYYNGGRKASNTQFKKVVGYLRASPNCGRAGLNGTGGRMHWGKAGWPDFGCWRGDVEYPDTWCDFGCAVQSLDPTNKFVGSAPDRFTWEGVNLAQCCGPNGFDKSKPGCTCTVKHARAVEDCPPSPYYTYR